METRLAFEPLQCMNTENPAIQTQRYDAHGWNDTSLLKEQDVSGEHPRTSPHIAGRKRPETPASRQGRRDLFGVMQGLDQYASDAWVGNNLIDPSKGKSAVPGPKDPMGRRDLFDVLNGKNPGKPSDDQWLGNPTINPLGGKFRPAGPEENAGRRDLFDIIQQASGSNGNEASGKKLADLWIGNRLIDPLKGKLRVDNVQAAKEHLIGSSFRGGVPKGWSDMKRPCARKVIPKHIKENPTAREVITGLSKIHTQEAGLRPLREARVNDFDHRENLYPIIQNSPVSPSEQQNYAGAWNDSGVTRRKQIHPYPGQVHPSKGIDLLHWKPNEKVGNYVKYGGLMQEQLNICDAQHKNKTRMLRDASWK